jgi:hypothetical protein
MLRWHGDDSVAIVLVCEEGGKREMPAERHILIPLHRSEVRSEFASTIPLTGEDVFTYRA